MVKAEMRGSLVRGILHRLVSIVTHVYSRSVVCRDTIRQDLPSPKDMLKWPLVVRLGRKEF